MLSSRCSPTSRALCVCQCYSRSVMGAVPSTGTGEALAMRRLPTSPCCLSLIPTCCQLAGLSCSPSSVKWNYLIFREEIDIGTQRIPSRYSLLFSLFFTSISLTLSSISKGSDETRDSLPHHQFTPASLVQELLKVKRWREWKGEVKLQLSSYGGD